MDAFTSPTNLQNVFAVGIKRSLNQFDHEDAVGATGLSVQTGVGNLPFLLTWKTQKAKNSHKKHV